MRLKCWINNDRLSDIFKKKLSVIPRLRSCISDAIIYLVVCQMLWKCRGIAPRHALAVIWLKVISREWPRYNGYCNMQSGKAASSWTVRLAGVPVSSDPLVPTTTRLEPDTLIWLISCSSMLKIAVYSSKLKAREQFASGEYSQKARQGNLESDRSLPKDSEIKDVPFWISSLSPKSHIRKPLHAGWLIDCGLTTADESVEPSPSPPEPPPHAAIVANTNERIKFLMHREPAGIDDFWGWVFVVPASILIDRIRMFMMSPTAGIERTVYMSAVRF